MRDEPDGAPEAGHQAGGDKQNGFASELPSEICEVKVAFEAGWAWARWRRRRRLDLGGSRATSARATARTRSTRPVDDLEEAIASSKLCADHDVLHREVLVVVLRVSACSRERTVCHVFIGTVATVVWIGETSLLDYDEYYQPCRPVHNLYARVEPKNLKTYVRLAVVDKYYAY